MTNRVCGRVLGLLLTDAGYAVTAEQKRRRALDRAIANIRPRALHGRMRMDGLTFLPKPPTRQSSSSS